MTTMLVHDANQPAGHCHPKWLWPHLLLSAFFFFSIFLFFYYWIQYFTNCNKLEFLLFLCVKRLIVISFAISDDPKILNGLYRSQYLFVRWLNTSGRWTTMWYCGQHIAFTILFIVCWDNKEPSVKTWSPSVPYFHNQANTGASICAMPRLYHL